MEIRIETESYNERRYGRPWIAKVTFDNPKGNYAWGNWIGDSRNGGAGVLEIAAGVGDIIATGQKDNRKSQNSSPTFFVVEADGRLNELGDKGAAYKHWMEKKSTVDISALMSEKESLLRRIAEINSILNVE